MKIAVIAPARHPIVEPYAGGLEAFCGLLVEQLRRRGHHVDFYAARGSHGHVVEYEFPGVDWRGFDAYASDVSYPPGQREAEDEAFRRLRHHLEASDYDVIHNNSLHPELLRSRILPLLTTLHCPPLAEMEQALADSTSALTAVSQATADSWDVPGPVAVIPNGVDGAVWRPRPGPVGEHAIWFGRLVPEKGAHVAIDACRQAGMRLLVVGRCGDPSYWDAELLPRTGDDVRFLAPQRHRDLARLVGSAAVAAVTPLWDEPFGLVTVEAMACGTPVVAFARGGIVDTMRDAPGMLVPPGDVDAFAAALLAARHIDRAAVARHVQRRHSLNAVVTAYLAHYRAVARDRSTEPA